MAKYTLGSAECDKTHVGVSEIYQSTLGSAMSKHVRISDVKAR